MVNETQTQQSELSYQNSVTELLPDALQSASALVEQVGTRLEAAGITVPEDGSMALSRSSSPDRPFATQGLSITRDPESGMINTILVSESEIIDEPANPIHIVHSRATYDFTEADGVKHIQATVNNSRWVVGGEKPATTVRTDSPEDLAQVQAILGEMDSWVDGTIDRERRIAANKSEWAAGQNAKAKSAGSKLLGLLTGRR